MVLWSKTSVLTVFRKKNPLFLNILLSDTSVLLPFCPYV